MKKISSLFALSVMFCFVAPAIVSAQDEVPATGKRTPLESPYSGYNILGFSGIDLGLRYSKYTLIPRDEYTGNSLLAPGVQEPSDKPMAWVNMYSINFQLYGSVIGYMLLKKRDRKFIIADISELGMDLGGAVETGKQYDGQPMQSISGNTAPNKTVGSLVTAAAGVLLAYRLSNDSRISLRYQYLIDQGVIFRSRMDLDQFRNFDMSRKRITGTFSYKEYLAEANACMPWGDPNRRRGNKGWGVGIKKRVGDGKHLGVKMDFIYLRHNEQSGTRNWHTVMLSYGTGI